MAKLDNLGAYDKRIGAAADGLKHLQKVLLVEQTKPKIWTQAQADQMAEFYNSLALVALAVSDMVHANR
jgi:hypothetical protein